jgi:hypothetical protein
MLEFLYEQGGGRLDQFIELGSFIEDNGLDIQTGYALIRAAAESKLVNDASSLSVPCGALTLPGVDAVRRRRREAPAARRRALYAALLRRLHEQEEAGANMPVVSPALLEGGPFRPGVTDSEVDRAAAYLVDNDLIRGIPVAEKAGPVRASVTSKGLDCLDNYGGDVTAYLERGRRGGGGTTIGTVTVHNSSGNVAIAGDATQHVTTEVDLAALARIIQALLDGLPRYQLPPEAAAGEALREAQRELESPNPDPGRIRSAISRVGAALAKVAAEAWPALTVELVFAAARASGVPV